MFLSKFYKILQKPSPSYFRSVATDHRFQRRRVRPAAERRLQHQLHRQEERDLGAAAPGEQLRGVGLQHGDALHLQRQR